MTKAKHTSGPWNADYGFVIAGADVVALVRSTDFDRDTNEANAHLIAAAPDLLKHLEDAAHWLKDLSLIARRGGNTELANRVTEQASKAYAAIAKARGEAV